MSKLFILIIEIKLFNWKLRVIFIILYKFIVFWGLKSSSIDYGVKKEPYNINKVSVSCSGFKAKVMMLGELKGFKAAEGDYEK